MLKKSPKLEQIKKLRLATLAGVMDCRQALQECSCDFKKAQEWLKEKGLRQADKRAERKTSQGVIEAYCHANGKILAVVELLSETDFVSRTEEFKNLAHELAMQVAAMKPKNAAELLKQVYIRDESRTVEGLIKELIAKIGENIKVNRIARFELGE